MNCIMIVDDDKNELKAMEITLNKMNVDIMVADNAVDAMALIEEKTPDLILLDVLMPFMDGFEFCTRLKSRDATSDIPVIFLTGLDRSENIIKGFEVGGDDYLLKPIALEELYVRVQNHLKSINLQTSLKKRNLELQTALEKIKKLEGLLPICSFCNKIRDEQGNWNRIETYIQQRSEAKFSHSLCSACATKHYPDLNIPGVLKKINASL